MAVTIKKGDLFAHTFSGRNNTCIGHGVNSAGAMGAGIAIEFKKRFPEMFSEYRNRCQSGLIFPGITWIWKEPTGIYLTKQETLDEEHIWIYNLAIKAHWKLNATYEAIEDSLKNMAIHMNENSFEEIGLPWIGCGLGGLEKSKVKAIMEKISEDYKINIVVYEQ